MDPVRLEMAIPKLYNNIILAGSALALAISLTFLVAAPSCYTATALIQVKPDSHSLDQVSPNRGPLIGDVILDQVGSAEMIGPTVDRFGLSVSRDSMMRDAEPRRAEAISAIRNGLHVNRIAGRDPWVLSYSSARSTTSAAILDDLVNRIALSGNVLMNQAGEAQRTLVNAIHDEMAETSAALARIDAARASLVVLNAKNKDRIMELQGQLPSARKSGQRASSAPRRSASESKRRADSGLDLTELRDQRDKLLTRQVELARTYGRRYPLMIELDQQISQLDILIHAQRRLENASGALADRGSTQANGLRKLVEGEQSLAAYAATQTSLLDQLAHELRGTLAGYETILNQQQMSASSESLHVRVLRWPSARPRRDPSIWRNAAAGIALLAAVVAVAGMTARVKRGQLFETAADVRRSLGLSVAAVIPKLRPAKIMRGRDQPNLAAGILVEGSDRGFIEAFQQLQRAFGIRSGGAPPLVVAVCSALPNEGKTTVSVCLARSSALNGLKVVLVDCDGRRRALSKLFPDAHGPGLVQLLHGDAQLDEASAPDPDSGVCIILHSSTDDVEDLSTPTLLKKLLVELRAQFDLIILDTGPVLALVEARVVAALCDDVLLVARWRKTPVTATRLALSMLIAAGARVKGVALNVAELG